MDDIHDPTVVPSGPTSQSHASSAQPKQTLKQLIDQKENLEAELTALGSVLDSHGVNMRTGLTTFDGFPRADIDVPQIRTTRARIIRLKNDHKALMARLEEAVHEQFAAGRAPETTAQSNLNAGSSRSMASVPALPALEPPFARVNTVVSGSPAEQAGLKVGDKVTKFGIVNWTNHERLSKVALAVQQNENVSEMRYIKHGMELTTPQRMIVVKVLREAEDAVSRALELQLTPRQNWGGRGLLGCHLLPL
jgi:26S proteasome non-ATPase regulatory subunit 9